MHVKLCATCGGVTFLHHRTLTLSLFFFFMVHLNILHVGKDFMVSECKMTRGSIS